MNVYKACFDIVMALEGVYDSPEDTKKNGDSGGETFKGISRNNFGNWEGWKIIDDFKSKGINPSTLGNNEELTNMVLKFYKENFWDKMSLDLISQQSPIIAAEMFDTGVNMYWGTSAKFLQTTLNALNRNQMYWKDIVVDGMIGNGTINAFNEAMKRGYEDVIVMAINGEQIHKYMQITQNDPTQEIFFVGWVRHRGKDPFTAYKSLKENV